MIGIEYSKYNGLNSDIIMAMLNSDEVGAFINKMRTHAFICFNTVEGADVNLCDKPDPTVSVCLHLDAVKLREIIDQANALLVYPIPAHIYIDLDDGYQMMISKDEYPAALRRL